MASLMLLVLLVYWPGLSGPFLLDDPHNISENPAIQVDQWTLEAVREAATAYGSRLPHRPISTLSLAVDHWLWDGEVFGFKLTNLLIHLLNTLLIFVLSVQLFRLMSDRGSHSWSIGAGLVIAAVWAIHPLQVSTVLYVVQRMEMLAVTFILLSLIAYIRARCRLIEGVAGSSLWGGLAGLFTVLAVFSKETGVLAPLFMLTLELVVFRFACADDRSARRLKFGFLALVGAYVLVYLGWLVPEHIGPDRFLHRDFSWDERLLTQLRVLPMYLGWILLPISDHYLFYYDHFSASRSLLHPVTTLLGAGLLLVLAIFGWVMRERSPLIALGVFWFFIAHALTSNVFSLELVFEHRNYLAVFAVLLVLAGLLKFLPVPSSRTASFALCGALVLGLALISGIRSATWGGELNLATHHVELNPNSARAGLDLAEIYLDYSDGYGNSPFASMAVAEFERVAGLPKSSLVPDQALILLSLQWDVELEMHVWERMQRKAEVRSLTNADWDAVFSLVQTRYRGGELNDDQLVQLYVTLKEREATPAEILVRFGYYAIYVLEDEAMAREAFSEAARRFSSSPGELEALRRALREAGIDLDLETSNGG